MRRTCTAGRKGNSRVSGSTTRVQRGGRAVRLTRRGFVGRMAAGERAEDSTVGEVAGGGAGDCGRSRMGGAGVGAAQGEGSDRGGAEALRFLSGVSRRSVERGRV